MNFANSENLEVSGNLFDLISTGGIVAGSDVLVTRNEFKRCNEDFWRIPRPKIGGVGFGCTNYRFIENVFHDSWSRFRLHPDFLQIDDYHNSPHAGQQLEFVIERNVVWLGDGMFCPVSPSGYGQDAFVMWDTLPATMPMTNERVNRIRQTTAGTTTLATGAPEGTQIAVQLEARNALYEPITILPGAGQSFIEQGSGAPLASVTLIRPNQTVEFTMGADGVITVQFYTCDNNMVQSNYAANKGTIRGIIRNNIFATNGSISARLGANWVAGSVANQNTMMRVLPGDVTGDGVPNTHADGFVDPENNPKIVIETAAGSASGNIVNAVNNGGGGATANNLTVDWSTPSAVTTVFPLVTIENGGLKNFPTNLQDTVARALTISAAATAAKQGAGWDDAGNAVDWTWTDNFGSGPDLALGNGSVAGGSGPQFAAAA
ncbi:MAG: hypothetical protein AAGC86_06970 [Pseudomonadota bacterium]